MLSNGSIQPGSSDPENMSASSPRTPLLQVVNGEGVFQTDALEKFAADNKLAESKTDYQVVAIMGPQSSGKSTLLNHVFGTGFQMMDAMSGRSQTTKGVWLSRAPKISDRTTLVMDLEGSDGRERGEDDTNFERQSALFALSVADVLMVNIWCHDIGREHGSGKPLLKTIFQVNLKLFAPEPNRRRTVLLFVIRDKSKTPLPKLVEVMESDLEKMWASISKPPQYTESRLHDFFEVQYAGLAHFEEKYEDFVADTVMLRRRFSLDVEDSLVHEYDDKLPGEVFFLSIRNIWEVIRSQKDLNLPAHKIMVANIRCREIAEDQLKRFSTDQAWESLRSEAMVGLVPGFGARAHDLMDSCVKGYVEEASYFDRGVREEKQNELVSKLEALVLPLYREQARRLHTATLATFERDLKASLVDRPNHFAECAASCRQASLEQYTATFQRDVLVPGTPWDGLEEQGAMTAAVDAYVESTKAERVADARQRAERAMATAISGPAIGLLDVCPANVWPRLHAISRDAAAVAERKLLDALSGYTLTSSEEQALRNAITAAAETRLENHVREAALTRISRMKDRFHEVFTMDDQKTPRMWTARDDIPLIARQARAAAANVLAQLAIIRPDGPEGTALGRMVDLAVARLAQDDLAVGGTSAASSGSALGTNSFGRSISFGMAPGTGGEDAGAADEVLDVHSATVWPNADPDIVLVQPHEVRTSWREFMSTSNMAVQQALATQQANKLASKRSLPLWALAAIVFLGWNEFMGLVWNPVWLIIAVLLALFLRTLYSELDVDAEMQRGALPGALAIAAKFMPAVHSVLQRTLAAGQALAAKQQELASALAHGDHTASHHAGQRDDSAVGQAGRGAAAGDGAAGGSGLVRRRPTPTADGEGGLPAEVEMTRKDR